MIRKATINDLPRMMQLFDAAKEIMRSSGNMNQWTGNYPSEMLIRNEIAEGNSFLLFDDFSKPAVATFAFILTGEPTYSHIYNGSWLCNERPYGVIHRLASTPESHGVALRVFNWCFDQCHNLRADTHRDNLIMQHLLLKNGFSYCGIIYLANGDERLAYQRISLHAPQTPMANTPQLP